MARSWFSQTVRPPVRLTRRRRPTMEILEDRVVPATFTVTTLADENDGLGVGGVSLREAIAAANANGPGADTIDFAVTGTIPIGSQLPTVGSELTILGPGADQLTLQRAAAGAFSLLVVNFVPTFTASGLTLRGSSDAGLALVEVFNADVTFTDCVFADNLTSGARSGAIEQDDGSLTLVRCLFMNNHATGGGAGGAVQFDGGPFDPLTVLDSTFTGNRAEGGAAGGAIRTSSDSPAFVTGSTFTNNSAFGGSAGGAIASMGPLTVRDTLFAFNAAVGSAAGAVYLGGGGSLVNSTVHGNRSAWMGGGVVVDFGETATITHSTITGNVADDAATGFGSGGGLLVFTGASVTVANSIIAGNFDTPNNAGPQTNPPVAHPDISGPVIDAGGNLIGVTQGATGLTVSTLLGTMASPLDPGLHPLANNGGPTQTRALTLTSPALDSGTNPLIPSGLTTDQRGLGFPRLVNGTVDIGAFESQTPVVTLAATDPTADELPSGDAGLFTLTRTGTLANPLTVTITIDAAGTAGLGTDYVLGFPQGTSAFSVSGNTITLTFAAGSDTATFGLFVLGDLHAEADETAILTLNDGAAYDLGTSTSGTVVIERNDFVVINTNSQGEGSLLQAVLNANYFATADTVTFDTAGVFATPQVIVIEGTLSFTDAALTTIQGTGQTQLVLDGHHGAPTAFLHVGANAALRLVDLSLANGVGRAVSSDVGSSLTLDHVTVTDNQGGGVQSSGSLTVVNSWFWINAVASQHGGAIYALGGTVSITGSTFAGNRTATGDGGAVYSLGVLSVRDSLFVGNLAPGGSGGGLVNAGPPSYVANTTFSGNSAGVFGGAVFNASTLTLANVTVTANAAPTGGGVMTSAFAPITLHNTLVAGNTDGAGTPSDLAGNPGAYAAASSHNLVGTGGVGGLTGGNGNLLNVADPRLGPLTDNGGLTRTHALLIDSPARNAGDNARAVAGDGSPLPTDQRGAGFPRVIGGTVDIGAFELQSGTVAVAGVDIDDGTDLAVGNVNVPNGQHSAVRRITVALTGVLAGVANGTTTTGTNTAIHLGGLNLNLVRLQGGATFTVTARYLLNGNGTSRLVLTFAGGSGDTQVVGGSLADGDYRLTFVAGFGGGPAAVDFYRLFGDARGDGDRTVDDNDLAAFRAALRSRNGQDHYRSYFDADNDGDVDAADYAQFQRRYRTRL